MKLKHLILFILAGVVLYLSDLYLGSLLVLICVFQMALLVYQIPLSKKSQLASFYLFLISLPLILFYAGINSFIQIYIFEKQWFLLCLALSIEILLCFAIYLQCIYIFKYFEDSQFQLVQAFEKTVSSIKDNKKTILKNTLYLFVLGFIPKLASDWKIVISIMVIHLIQNPSLLKQVVLKTAAVNSRPE